MRRQLRRLHTDGRHRDDYTDAVLSHRQMIMLAIRSCFRSFAEGLRIASEHQMDLLHGVQRHSVACIVAPPLSNVAGLLASHDEGQGGTGGDVEETASTGQGGSDDDWVAHDEEKKRVHTISLATDGENIGMT